MRVKRPQTAAICCSFGERPTCWAMANFSLVESEFRPLTPFSVPKPVSYPPPKALIASLAWPIPERFEFISLRHFVASAEERDQRDLHLLVAVVEDPFVGDLQQRIKDRAARLEDFVEEDEFGLDQLTRRNASVLVALQPCD